MSNVFMSGSMRFPMSSTSVQVNKLLVENNYLIQTIIDLQSKNRMQESVEYLKVLQRNLDYLIQIHNLNIPLSDIDICVEQSVPSLAMEPSSYVVSQQQQLVSQLDEEVPPNVTAPFDPMPIPIANAVSSSSNRPTSSSIAHDDMNLMAAMQKQQANETNNQYNNNNKKKTDIHENRTESEEHPNDDNDEGNIPDLHAAPQESFDQQ